MRRHRSFVSLAALLSSASIAAAQNYPQGLPPPQLRQNPSSGENLVSFLSARTPYEFWLTCLICAIGLIVIAALIWAVSRVENRRAEDITRPVIVVTVIIGTLILVTAG